VIYFDDVKMGEKIITRGRTITEADIVMFAALSGDWYELHVNKEVAKNSPFGERIAHGMLVLSIATGFITPYETAVIAFYGMDKVRFVGATKIGDTIHVESEVVELKDKGTHGVVSHVVHVKNQHGEDVAILTTKVAMGKKP